MPITNQETVICTLAEEFLAKASGANINEGLMVSTVFGMMCAVLHSVAGEETATKFIKSMNEFISEEEDKK